MAVTLEPLIADFLAWLDAEPRGYHEALEAWRTNCPRLTVWEEAHDRGLVARVRGADGTALVVVTEAGRAFSAARRPSQLRW
jgi:hypothetical protein